MTPPRGALPSTGDDDLLRELLSEQRQTLATLVSGVGRLEVRIERVGEDVAELRERVLTGTGSLRPLTTRVDALERDVARCRPSPRPLPPPPPVPRVEVDLPSAPSLRAEKARQVGAIVLALVTGLVVPLVAAHRCAVEPAPPPATGGVR